MEKLLTLYEVAQYLRLNKFTVYRMVERGQLPAIRVANQWRFKEKDIDTWLEENKRAKRKAR
jgi:excisionase family DNA binding protein